MEQFQTRLDGLNRQYWDELCGAAMACQLGIHDSSPPSLARFDKAYFAKYPYLAGYFLHLPLESKRVLEIGLGFGSLGQALAERGCEYYGIDVAEGPVTMMRHRLSNLGDDGADRIRRGSALDLPFPDAHFDFVFSIGCLHHTGDIGRGVAEIQRVLRTGGTAVVMLYNRHSLRQWCFGVWRALCRVVNILRKIPDGNETLHGLYDANLSGEVAPHIDFVSAREARRIFGNFSRVDIEKQNFDDFRFLMVPRSILLATVGRIVGLDLYIVAVK